MRRRCQARDRPGPSRDLESERVVQEGKAVTTGGQRTIVLLYVERSRTATRLNRRFHSAFLVTSVCVVCAPVPQALYALLGWTVAALPLRFSAFTFILFMFTRVCYYGFIASHKHKDLGAISSVERFGVCDPRHNLRRARASC